MTPNEALKLAKQALDSAQETQRNNKAFMAAIGPALIEALTPLLTQLKGAVSSLKLDVTPNVTVEPNVHLPAINVSVPEIRVPKPEVTVNVPPSVINVDVPEIKIPDFNVNFPEQMSVRGWIGFMGYDKGLLNNPLPVQIRDAKGNPIDFSALGSSIIDGGGSSGGGNFPMQVFDPATNALRVTGNFSISASNSSTQAIDSSGTPYSQANPMPVTVVSGGAATTGAALVDSGGVQYSGSNPLPVTITSGGTATSASNIVDSSGVAYSGSNPLPVSNVGLPVAQGDSATALRVVIAGNSDASVVVNNASLAVMLVDSGAVAYSGSNPIPVSNIGLPVGQGDSATAQRVVIAGDSVSSVYVNNPVGAGEQATALRVVIAGDSGVTVSAQYPQAQGDSTSALRVVVAGDSVTSVIVNNPQGPGEQATALRVLVAGDSVVSVYAQNPFGPGEQATALRILVAGDSAASVNVNNASLAVNIVDSGGTGYSGSNPVPVTLISGALSSTIVVGASSIGTADDGSAPLQGGGIARTANPTKVTGGQVVKQSMDAIGRPLTRPVQVRELLATAYVSLTNGTETALATAAAGTYLDLVYIMGANTSSVAQQIDIRAVSGGNVMMTLYLPAQSTAGVSLPVPIPQDATGNAWTADNADVTNSTVYVSALFSKEV